MILIQSRAKDLCAGRFQKSVVLPWTSNFQVGANGKRAKIRLRYYILAQSGAKYTNTHDTDTNYLRTKCAKTHSNLANNAPVREPFAKQVQMRLPIRKLQRRVTRTHQHQSKNTN